MHKNNGIGWQAGEQAFSGNNLHDNPDMTMADDSTDELTGMPVTAAASETGLEAMPQLQRIAENIPGILLEYESLPDGTHQYTYLSPAFEFFFGISPKHIFKITQFIHPDDLGELNATLSKAADTLAPFYIESRMIVPGMGIVWRSMSCSFSHCTANGSRVFTGLMLDITERKKADEKLNESEHRLETLITNLQHGILVEDENRKVVLANELYCDMFGFGISPENMKGRESADFIDSTKALFRDEEFFEERIFSLLEFQKPSLNEIIEMKDGRILKRDFIPISNNRNYKGQLWKYADVTAQTYAENTLKIREEKYRSIIDNMNLGLLEVDTEENIVFANHCFCEMCGYELDELMGKRAANIFAKGENIELMDQQNEERKKGTTDAYEIVVKNKRGEVRWWLISGAPRYNDKGELVGSIGIHLDITDQKQLEIELTVAREQAEESTRSKELFLANMSHEIRTPMNAILGMSNQLGKSQLNKKQLFCLDAINAASENLLLIINDILDLSKIEAGKLSLEKIAFEPRAVIKRSILALNHKAEEKGLALTNSFFDERISPVMMGDPYRLNQVLLNIISNAVKFTEKGSVDIRMEVINDARQSQTVQLTVKDTGIGMDEKFRKSLFEKFSQEDTSVTRQYGGTGLGMSICRQLIELMDGEIFVDSEKGNGTTMSFVITLAKGHARDLPSKEKFIADEKMLLGKTILVVDDNEMNRLLATTILDNFGAVTIEAENGRECIEYLAANAVDIVLLDIQMPVMDGFDAARYIRQHISTSLPIVALTANAIKGDNEKCIAAGMSNYLAKPFKEEDLMKMIAGILQISPVLNDSEEEDNAGGTETGLPIYDISEIKIISRGNDGFIHKMLKMFVEQMPVHLKEMKEKYEEKQYITVGEIAHRIKPTIDNMGIVSCKNIIREIEKIAKCNEDDGKIAGLIKKVETDVLKAVNAIKKDFQL